MMFGFGHHCSCEACMECSDGGSEYEEEIKEEIALRAKIRRIAIKKGNHWRDQRAECNLTEFDGTARAVYESRYEFKTHDLWPLINIITEYAVGQKDDYDDRCAYCLRNKGSNFFEDHPSPKLSCYSCKCNHISMLTQKQATKKYPKLTSVVFHQLRRANKSVKILRTADYRIQDEYFLMDDIDRIKV